MGEEAPVHPNAGRLRILGIGGSLRRESLSYVALEHAISMVSRLGCQATIFDVRRVELPFCNGDKRCLWPEYPAVAELRHAVREADGLILATPEYHGGISGVMKNLLDLLDFEHLEGKVVGGISVLGGRHNSNALNDLRRIIRWCHGWMIPEQIAIGEARSTLVDGEIRSPDLQSRLEVFAESLVRSTLRLNDYFLPSRSDP